MSLIETVVGLGLLGAAAIGVSHFVSNATGGIQYVALKGQLEDIRNLIRVEMDCEQTLAGIGAACDGATSESPQPSALLRRDGSQLITQGLPETVMANKFRVRARCIDSTSSLQFIVEAKQQSLAASPHGLSATVASNWGDLFMGIPIVCAKSVVAPLPLTLNITADGQEGPITIAANDAVTLDWVSTNFVSCSVAPGGWTGTSGSQLTGPLSATVTYTLTCLDAANVSTTDQVTVNVGVDLALDTGYCIRRRRNALCPEGYAAFGFTDPTQSLSPSTIDTLSSCCKVPPDFLTTDHTFETQNCWRDGNNNRVVTGGTTSGGENLGPCQSMGLTCRMRCTKINTARYKLGPRRRGDFWTAPGCPCVTGGGGATWRSRSILPLAMRFGSGRGNLTTEAPNQYLATYDMSFCMPISLTDTGGIMIQKFSKQCGDYWGVQALYTGNAPGDTADNPVQLLPSCTADSVAQLSDSTERYFNFMCQ